MHLYEIMFQFCACLPPYTYAYCSLFLEYHSSLHPAYLPVPNWSSSTSEKVYFISSLLTPHSYANVNIHTCKSALSEPLCHSPKQTIGASFYCTPPYCSSQIMYYLKIESLWQPISSKSVSVIFPTAFVHFMSLCHILVIVTIFQNSHYYICSGDL